MNLTQSLVQVFVDQGKQTILENNTHKILQDENDLLLYVESGTIDLFFMEEDIDEATFETTAITLTSLNYLCSIGEGNFFFSFPILAEARVVAIARKLTVIKELPLSQVQSQNFNEKALFDFLFPSINQWVVSLSAQLEQKELHQIDCFLKKEDSFWVPTNAIAVLPKQSLQDQHEEFLWIKVTEGKLAFADYPICELMPNSPLFPLAPYVCVKAIETTHMQIFTHWDHTLLETKGQTPAWWKGITFFNFCILKKAQENNKQKANEDFEDLKKRVEYEKEQLKSTYEAEKKIQSQHSVRVLIPQKEHESKILPPSLEKEDILQTSIRNSIGDLWMALLATLLSAVVGVFSPFAIKILFDHVIPKFNLNLLGQIAFALAIATLSSILFIHVRQVSLLRFESYFYSTFNAATWRRLLLLPLKFFRQSSTGEIFQRLQDLNEIQIVSNRLIKVTLNALFSFIFLFTMFYFSFSLSLLALMLVMAYFLISIGLSWNSWKTEKQISQSQGALYSRIFQMTFGISKIRSNNAEIRILSDLNNYILNLRNLEASLGFTKIFFRVLHDIFPGIALFCIFLMLMNVKAYHFIYPTLGSYLAFTIAFANFYSTFIDFQNSILQNLKIISLWKGSQLFFTNPIETNHKGKNQLLIRGEMQVEHLYFRYDKDSLYVFEDLSFQVSSGEFIGIISPAGNGKTTLMRLLLGFELPSMGAVYYDNHNLNDLSLQNVRQQVGSCLQNSRIFQGSIRDNLTLFRPYTEEQIKEAIKITCLDQDLAKMPLGIDTPLHSDSSLSGGQKQKLFLARALIGAPKILILEEPTHGIDNNTQQAILKNLAQCSMTRILISHSVNTLIYAHKIYVLHQGKVVQKGTFAELEKEDGLFARLIESQKF